MITRFFIYGLLGWGLEIFWTGLGSAWHGNWRLTGHTYLWMLPIYGLAVLFEPFHEAIRSWTWYRRGLVWMLLIWLVEYASGGLLRLTLGVCPWDYRGVAGNINGLIRLDYGPAWFALGLVFEQVHDWLRDKATL